MMQPAGVQRETRQMRYYVLSAGMSRSASTWLFNIARKIVETETGGAARSGWVDDFRAGEGDAVVKLHGFDAEKAGVASHILYSYRDIRDVLASRMRIWSEKPTLKTANHLIRLHECWSRVATTALRYDDIIADPAAAAARVGAALGAARSDPSAIAEEVAAMKFDRAQEGRPHDCVTLFHKNHITDGRSGVWGDHLAPAFVEKIEARHEAWFRDNGFALTTR